MNSIWMDTVTLPSFAPLQGDVRTDVLIIGGGLTGVLCAYTLHNAGVRCVLIEADRLGLGTSGHTTAKLTSQHGLLYHRICRTYGEERARLYYEANEKALARFREMSRTIACDLEERDSYVYACDNTAEIEKELKALDAIGASAAYAEHLPLPFTVAGAVKFPRQAQFHPRKFMAGLLDGLTIHEHTRAAAFDGRRVQTAEGSVTASHIVVATHFPLFNKHGGYPLKLYQHRSYVLALEGAPHVGGMYVDAKDTGLSFRDSGKYVLLGGGAHRTGEDGGKWRELETFAKTHYREATVSRAWAAQDCMSLDGIPYIGTYAGGTPRMYVATGFNKWGMTAAMVASQMVCEAILERSSPYTALFSPSRRMWHPQLVVNALEAIRHIVTFKTPRCPHMGCALEWNEAEHSWDCACHGSRFAKDGTILDGPANG